MRTITPETDAAWHSEIKAGATRAIVRATLEVVTMRPYQYNTADQPGSDTYSASKDRTGNFNTALFGQSTPHEIPNVLRYNWSRAVDQDVAECTLTILNTEMSPAASSTFEGEGQYSYGRAWGNLLAPDRLVRTYEGYGHDPSVMPGDDPNLYLSGTWLIDEVSYETDGNITLSMRDMGRLLLDQIAMPPVVPWSDYPMTWSTISRTQVPGRDCAGGGWWTPPASGASSSNTEFVGASGLPAGYVSSGGVVQGHRARDGVRTDDDGLWLSTAMPDRDDFVWWQIDFANPQNISGLRMKCWRGSYRIYVSFKKADGTWIGKKKIPYSRAGSPGGVDINADIHFSESFRSLWGTIFDHTLRRKHRNIVAVRLTFTRLHRQDMGDYPFRAGLKSFAIYRGAWDDLHFVNGTVTQPTGNTREYTHIIKWICAWGGFYWPDSSSGANTIRYGSGPPVAYPYAHTDPGFPKGRVWGSFHNTGTSPISPLTADQFDKQPLMDCIGVVRDMIGFLFFIDETGGVVWRMPNIFDLGNYIVGGHKTPRQSPVRTDDVIVIDESTTLVDYTVKLSSRDLREYLFVSDTSGKYGTLRNGFTPYHIGFNRAAGWTDQHFQKDDTTIAADMVAAQQMFAWRTGTVTIPGNPAIQIDDQVRIQESITNENYYHYVSGISCDLDNEQGTWTYQLQTHWLGTNPDTAWVVKTSQLNGLTRAFIDLLQGGD